MDINFTQSSRSLILMRIETEKVCLQIKTSCVFDPFEEFYIWLGQIRDFQLPATIIIDEEGHGVVLIAKFNEQKNIEFTIKKWTFNDKVSIPIYLKIEIESDLLIQSFHDGITSFIKERYSIADSSFGILSNLNWDALLKKPAKLPDWKTRLAMYGGGKGQYLETGIDKVQLTAKQKELYNLRNFLHYVSMYGHEKVEILADLYKKLPIDIALDELDTNWYEQRKKEIDLEFELHKNRRVRKRKEKQILHNLKIARLTTLREGQLVDGIVAAFKPYGLFVNIAGIYALLHISLISKTSVSVEDLKQIFQFDAWVRAIIVNLDIEKGRVTLSTKDLEAKPGDMLKDPILVYQQAEEIAKIYRLNHGLEKF